VRGDETQFNQASR